MSTASKGTGPGGGTRRVSVLLVAGELDNDTQSGARHLIMVPDNLSAKDHRAKPVKLHLCNATFWGEKKTGEDTVCTHQRAPRW